MIEGLHFDFTGDELIAWLDSQASHHDDKTSFYKTKYDELHDAGHSDEQMSGGDVMQRLADKVKEHSDKAAEFRIMSSHIIGAEKYRLAREELYRIGMVSRY